MFVLIIWAITLVSSWMGGYPVGSLIKIPETPSFNVISAKMGHFPFMAQESSDNGNNLDSFIFLEPDIDRFPDKSDEKIINKVSKLFSGGHCCSSCIFIFHFPLV